MSSDRDPQRETPPPRRPAVRSIEARSGNRFNGLLRELGRFSALDRRLSRQIPAAIRDRIGVARVRGDCLVIAARDPVAAARARLLAPTLLQHAAGLWPEPLANWRVVVCPDVEFSREDQT